MESHITLTRALVASVPACALLAEKRLAPRTCKCSAPAVWSSSFSLTSARHFNSFRRWVGFRTQRGSLPQFRGSCSWAHIFSPRLLAPYAQPQATIMSRQRLLRATLGFLSLEPREPELQLLHRCFDTWRGIRDVVAGMARAESDHSAPTPPPTSSAGSRAVNCASRT
jgi:hypothetical protein